MCLLHVCLHSGRRKTHSQKSAETFGDFGHRVKSAKTFRRSSLVPPPIRPSPGFKCKQLALEKKLREQIRNVNASKQMSNNLPFENTAEQFRSPAIRPAPVHRRSCRKWLFRVIARILPCIPKTAVNAVIWCTRQTTRRREALPEFLT